MILPISLTVESDLGSPTAAGIGISGARSAAATLSHGGVLQKMACHLRQAFRSREKRHSTRFAPRLSEAIHTR
jgi:hypothetical protein